MGYSKTDSPQCEYSKRYETKLIPVVAFSLQKRFISIFISLGIHNLTTNRSERIMLVSRGVTAHVQYKFVIRIIVVRIKLASPNSNVRIRS